ncbi:MAG TPA: carboxylesterase/lipase family protein [Bacteroidales bacterium]|nr:carboxylesterase/lipase family protein [Bacteroidales bacterium]
MKTSFSFFLALLICSHSFCQAPSTLVNTQQGPVEGVVENGLIVYKGIPFATPPTGDLRWRPPRPPNKHADVFKADHFAPACPQPVYPGISDLRYGTSEDCLYLNIWKPAESNSGKIPVLVWIHGGGFTIGTASQPALDGEKLAAKGIIVVSIAYRLGALGFLSHPELSAESDKHVSGNYGILDQVAALQWVHDNIQAFGGDPGSVTIFGESAGGQSVNILAASPLAKGLFQKLISASGGYFGYASMKKEEETVEILKGAEQDGLEFQKKTGATSLAELRAIDPAKLIASQTTGTAGFSYWPVIDGFVIPDEVQNVYKSGKFSDVPALIGSTSDEGTLFILGLKPEDYPAYLQNRFGTAYKDKILQTYPVGSTSDSIRRSAADLLRDSYFGWYAYKWATLQNEYGKAPVYVYYFDQTLPPSPATMLFKSNKPYHGSDLAYVFNHLDLDPKIKYTDEDRKLSQMMVEYYTNFVKTGNPNGVNLPQWPVFNPKNPRAMLLKGVPQAIDYPNWDNVKMIDEYYEWKRGK